jgi:predicted DsbA family dithiol-disulfide isomerase/membrane-bound inhibitor of C-type lysozyme
MEQKNNPLLCDIETGMCETSDENIGTSPQSNFQSNKKSVKLIYYTDPICSSCWGIEPQLRKLKLEYGNSVEIEYRMGGLLPDWSYNGGGISKPSDVAGHWDEVSVYYDMPIDGDLWLEDPLDSSYPPSIAFKAAQMQDNEKAILFLREIREMVFLQKKNIAKWENLEIAAKKAGLNFGQFKTDYEGKAKELFNEDLKLGKELGVRGFPTLFFLDDSGNKEIVYGARPYAFYEMAILKLNPNAIKSEYSKNWEKLFAIYPTLTAKEFSELSGTPRIESEKVLDELSGKGTLEKLATKNGSIWSRKNPIKQSKMAKNILTIAMLIVLSLTSCQNAPKQEKTGTATTETVGDDVVTSSSTDKDGRKLELTFNNTKGTATLIFNGETIELHAQKAASGIWYKNDLYELRGKGDNVELTKDGKTVFKNYN